MRAFFFPIILFSLALTFIGLWVIPLLQFNFSASTDQRSISVNYVYPNASSRLIEQTVTVHIESALNRIREIDQVVSEIKRSEGSTRITLDESADVDFVRFKVVQLIRELYPSLPDQLHYPNVFTNDPNEEVLDPTLVSYSFSGPYAQSELFRYAKEVLIPALAPIPGIYEVRVTGAQEQIWMISIDEDKLNVLGLTQDEIISLLNNHLVEEGLSYGIINSQLKYIKTKADDLADLMRWQIPLNTSNQTIFWKDVVDLRRVDDKALGYYRINGQNSISLLFIPESNANHLSTAQKVEKHMINISNQLPNGCELGLSRDTTEYISHELSKIKDRSLWSLGILFLFVLFSYRSLSKVLLLTFCMLVTLSVASLFYYLLDIQLNLYALAAITVSFGIVIDNIIVVAHHYERHRDLSISPAILTANLTTLMALLIILFLPDQLQWQLSEFAKVLAINLMVAIFVSLLLVPAIIGYYQHDKSKTSFERKRHFLVNINFIYKALLLKLRRARLPILILIVILFGIPVFWLPSKIEGASWYNESIGSDYYQEEVKPWVNKVLGGTLRLFTYYVYDGSEIRSPEETKLYINASMPQGSRLSQMNELTEKIERYLGGFEDDIKSFVTQIFNSERAQIEISFIDESDIIFPFILKSELESLAIDLGGVDWNIYGIGRAFSTSSGSSPPRFKVRMEGYNLDILEEYAQSFAELLLTHPRISEVDSDANTKWWEKDQFQYVLKVDPRMLAERDWSVIELQALLKSFSQNDDLIGRTRENERIRVRGADNKSKNLWALLNQQLQWQNKSLMLSNMSDIEKVKMSTSILKENQQYQKFIEFAYGGSGQFGQNYLESRLAQFKPQLPMGYSIEQDRHKFSEEVKKKQYLYLFIVLVGIFILIAIHFESLKTALIIIYLIPTSYIGIFLTYYWFDFPFDQGGYTSFLLLSGLVVNSLIIIFSDYHRLLRLFPNREKFDLYLRAFRQKITPITITIISTALGLIPFTLHGSQEVFWFSLAVGVIGGLIFSLISILFIIPLTIGRGKRSPLSING